MQRAPERRRGAGALLLLVLVALAAAPRLVRAVTDAADGTLMARASPSPPLPSPPCPALLCSARSELVPWTTTASPPLARASWLARALVWGFACAGGLFRSCRWYRTAKRSTQAGGSD